jgi:serine/threonine protein kinase/Flp pilus assembly protein TadD
MKCPKCHAENPEDSHFCNKCATAFPPLTEIHLHPTTTLEVPLKELATGSTFAGRFEVIEELGKGGMGRVYKVLDKEIHEKLALKLLNPEIAADEKTIERFRNELKFARKISHRHVCRMYEFGKTELTYYITMEYVPGEDLKSMIRMMGQLSSGQAISIARQICEGLAEAHRLGVIHRDLKPQNIMIDREGNARIMDFGIARSIKSSGITGSGVMIGTPEYMSPEQVDGKEADQRSDIYSLGVILYEMVTGRVPFQGDTPFSVAVKHKIEAPKSPKELNAQIPDDLNRLILRCLEKERDKRYQGATEVLSELVKIEKGIPTTEKILLPRKPLTSREITVKFSLKKLFVPALVFLSLVIGGIFLLLFLPHKKSGSVEPGKPSLAIMYFENNTGDRNLDHWRKALSDLLITDLMQSKYINVLSGESLYAILKNLNLLEAKSFSLEDLKQVANRGGVEDILVGKYAKAGENLRIDVILQKASTGETVGSPEKVQGKGEESFFLLVDELTKKIKVNFNLTPQEIASDNDQEVGKITTYSPVAYKFYSEGRKYHMMGESAQSIPLMEKAIAIDPNFAMAYRSLAMSYGNQGSDSESKKYLQKAFELSSKVSERERYIIQGDYYLQSEKTFDKATEVYTKLLELYPDDSTGLSKLAYIYYYLEQWDKAIEKSETAIKYKDDSIFTWQYLAFSYECKGLFDKAVEVLRSYLNYVPDSPDIRLDLADAYFYQKKFDLALIEAEKAYALDPTYHYYFISKGDIYLYQGDLIKAEQEYQKLLNLKGPRAQRRYLSRMISLDLLQGKFEKAKGLANQGIEWASKIEDKWIERSFHDWLAYILQASGNLEEAVSENDKVWATAVEDEELGYQISVLQMKGLIYLEQKTLDKAQRTAAALQGLIQKGIIKNEIRHYYYLLGRIELERRNYSRAIEYFNKAIALLPYHWEDHALFADSLALAYYQAGDLEKARKEYERIISLPCGRTNYADIVGKSYYMLGRTYEQQGQKAKAIENYQKFLDLWKDADPGIPDIEDARKRLAGLRGQ